MARTIHDPVQRAQEQRRRASTRPVYVRFPNICFPIVETAHVRAVGGLPLNCERDGGWTEVKLPRRDAYAVLGWLLATPPHDPQAVWARRAADQFAAALRFRVNKEAR